MIRDDWNFAFLFQTWCVQFGLPRLFLRYLREYGCCKCQQFHREDEPIYEEHIMRQSKHGWRDSMKLGCWIDRPPN
jgi:hypothetical protein